MKCKTIGINLAKTVFQAYSVNEHIKPQFNKKLKRKDFIEFMAQQPPTVVVMEACYSSHHKITICSGHISSSLKILFCTQKEAFKPIYSLAMEQIDLLFSRLCRSDPAFKTPHSNMLNDSHSMLIT